LKGAIIEECKTKETHEGNAMSKEVKTLADCECEGDPICFHCDERLPDTATVERQGRAVVVYCPKCGCMTPFPISWEA